MPAEDQLIALPWASVMVTIVLLKMAFTCATPAGISLRLRLRMRWGSRSIIRKSYLFLNELPEPVCIGNRAYFCLLAVGFGLPLRVRALVCVLCLPRGRTL